MSNKAKKQIEIKQVVNDLEEKKTLPVENLLSKSKETILGSQPNHIPLTEDPKHSFLKSSCQECLYWLPSNDPNDTHGQCRSNPPSVHSQKFTSLGPIFIYPLTLKSTPACSQFKKS